MGKYITLTRRELVWETRKNTWTEEDYDNFLEWLSQYQDRTDANDSNWARNRASEYAVLSQYSWDDVVRIMHGKGEEDEPRIQYYDYTGEPSYKISIEEVIREQMREENFDAEVCDEDYADDFDEDFVCGEF
jgi:hypothetical protein